MSQVIDVKFPRTAHFTFSKGRGSDDIVQQNLDEMYGREVITTEKLDGEGTTLRPDRCHARSPDSRNHPSRDWIKQFHGRISHLIPEGYRICGENVYACHSIYYTNAKNNALDSYFYGFSVWNGLTALSWDDTLMWFEELGIVPVPTLSDEQGPLRGILDEKMYTRIVRLSRSLDTLKHEGFVTRTTAEIPYDLYGQRVLKWVRPNHVQTDEHWMTKPIIPNELKEPK